MKKSIVSIVFLCIISITSQAQGLYFGVNAGYGLKAGSETIGISTNANGSLSSVKGSLGAGFVSNLYAGYFFNKNIGAEFGIGYLVGENTPPLNIPITGPPPTSRLTKRANSFYINPSIVLRTGEGKIKPYGKMGIFLGLVNKETYNVYVSPSNYKSTYSGGFSTGITAAFGADYMISDKFSLFGELFCRLASWSPTKYSNGNTNGSFVSSMPANNPNSNALSIVSPLSAVGLNIGVKYYMFK